MIREGKGCGEVRRSRARGGIDACLEGITLAPAEALRQAPGSASAGERETQHGLACEAIFEAATNARRACGKIMATDHGEVAAGAIGTAETRAPHRPARLVDRKRLGRRL